MISQRREENYSPHQNDYRTPEMVALVTASIAARKNLAATVPTTVEGIAAALEYATAYHDEIRIPLFDSAKETQIFMQSLAQCARNLAR
jgi:hypothetical protein